MKKSIKQMSIFLLFSCLCSLFINCNDDDSRKGHTISVEDRSHAIEINNRLGRGMNMGNSFEAPSETAWDNPWQPEYFCIMADLGFKHVRLPIRWEPADRSMEEPPYTIYSSFLERIKTVVDEALKNDLYIIINMHHHEELYSDPAGQHQRFLAQWEQISSYFQSYSDKLLFEILNEPTDKMTAPIWNLYMSEALRIIRATNPDRVVLIGTAEGGGTNALQYLVLPEDENLILTIHYYNPFEFTHQGAEWIPGMEQFLGTKWYDSQEERDAIIDEFQRVRDFAANHGNIPVHIGEFGSINHADLESRARWTTFLARWFEEQGYSWAFWEFSAGFGIYNPQTGEFLQPLVDALLHNPMPEPGEKPDEPEPEPGILVYETDFSTDTDGWGINLNTEGIEATLNLVDNSLVTTITAGGTEGWHLQLAKTGVPLQRNKTYRCSFTVSSSTECAFEAYMDANDPYEAFNPGNYTVGSTSKTFYSTFTAEEDDDDTRIVFNLGQVPPTEFTLYKFKLEIIDEVPEPGSIIYQSNFSTGKDNWDFNVNTDGANASMTWTNNSLVVDIQQGGTDNWHLQLARLGIPLRQGRTYRYTFTVSSKVESSFEFYLDETVTYQSLFNPQHLTVGNSQTEFSSTFTMESPEESNARIVFNIGRLSETVFTLYSFKLEEIDGD